ADVMSEEQEKELRKELKKSIGKKQRFILYPQAISGATRKGIDELKNYLFQELQKIPKPEWLQEGQEYQEPKEYQDEDGNLHTPDTHHTPEPHITYRPHLENPKYYSVEKLKKGEFRIKGQRIEQIINMTNFDNREARARARDVLKKMGIDRELKKLGAKDGDTLYIGKKQMIHRPDTDEWDE